jgi:peptide subunit release factor 1 (eRF1)
MAGIRGLPPAGESRLLDPDRLLRVLNDLGGPSGGAKTEYVGVGTPPGEEWTWLPRSLRDSPHGLLLVRTPTVDLAIEPPFPLDLLPSGTHDANLEPIRELLERPRTVAVILLRLGAYAIGVVENRRLVMHRTGTRYVHGRHRAGGQSQRRFERNREQWAAKLFDEVCRLARERLEPYEGRLDHLAFGGDRHVIARFTRRCPYVETLSDRTLGRLVEVDRPGLAALERAASNLWRSRVYRAPQVAEDVT